MVRLRGTGIGSGMAIGVATVVRMRGGFPVVPIHSPARHDTGPPDLVIVADDIPTAEAFASGLTWGIPVGIVVRVVPDPRVTERVPVVAGLGSGLDSVAEGALILVDAVRGIVLIDPDAASVSHYQLQHEHIAPKHRVFLGDEHLPATTRDGHMISIAAAVRSPVDIVTAVEAGADVLYVQVSDYLEPSNGADSVLVDLSGAGKLLMIADDFALSGDAVLGAADSFDLIMIEPPRLDLPGLGITELELEWAEREAELFEQDVSFARPGIGTLFTELPASETLQVISDLADAGCARVVYAPEDAADPDANALRALGAVITEARRSLLPVFVTLGSLVRWTDGGGDSVARAIGLGAAGIIVAPESVGSTKEIVRDLSYTECRATLDEEMGS